MVDAAKAKQTPMSNFTTTNPQTSKKSFRVSFSRFLFVIAIILFILSSFVVVYPIAKFLSAIVFLAVAILYFFVIIFTLGFILLSEEFRGFLEKMGSLLSTEAIDAFYPTFVTYCLFALGAVVVIAAVDLILIGNKRKTYPTLFGANIVLLVLGAIAFIILLILKIITA